MTAKDAATEFTEENDNPSSGDPETAQAAEGAEAGVDINGETSHAEQPVSEESEQPAGGRAAELERLLEEQQQRLLRAQADFDNFRKRTIKEKEELGQYASMKLVGQLLPIVDNFERAIGASKESGDFESLSKGVDMIFRQLSQLLEQEGLKPMETVGRPFNPEFHQAVMTVESDEFEEGIVVEELQKGYVLKDRVLRPAMVKVSG
ncbi:MAG TPA: nucleotide exchange factor GrpE [Paenibacillus sp.]|uniref:nucleotide exchange factor GrpE n=1 Tax=Paenibacillus sp. TaxID=58172 RepID=UPI002C2BB803|nr:nucleotide exchange factor GrpE [Paenibacillus sp.]HUC93217.1 nucleotide exchange factor GrpE [Paenibacillus sp.]